MGLHVDSGRQIERLQLAALVIDAEENPAAENVSHRGGLSTELLSRRYLDLPLYKQILAVGSQLFKLVRRKSARRQALDLAMIHPSILARLSASPLD